MVISSSSNTQHFDNIFRNCLSQRLEPNEFFEEVYRLIVEESGNFTDILKTAEIYASICPEERDIFPLALEYLKILFVNGFIHPQQYLTILTTFNCWLNPCLIEEIKLHVESYINNKKVISCEANGRDLCLQISIILEWYIYSLDKIVENINETNFDDFSVIFLDLISAIRQLREQPFTALIIFEFYSETSDKSTITDNIERIQTISTKLKENLKIKEETELLKSKENDEMEIDEKDEENQNEKSSSSISQHFDNYLHSLDELIELFPLFLMPPKPNWEPCREDFIHRKYRPALLSLGSIFAIFRVIKTADEVADTFLTVGNVLGMKHEQIVEDLLRAGFLIQLETSNTCSEQREREALADVFVFIKLPQVLNRLIERGIQRQTISKALESICNCDSLLDQVDDKKSDNVFRFFLDGMKKADVINSKEHEFLTKKRDLKRSLNDELPTSANERQMLVRSELISRVQKAKRGIDTLVPENTERLLRRLLSLGEVPIDMLCCIYCACGELSLFSSKLAALNVQSQQPSTSENVSGATTNAQGRLLIFDSTFLLMARIQYVFSDMRLEELVGGRLHCAFYRWTQRYQKCIEEGVSMNFILSSQTDSLVDDSDETLFRSNFQRNQYQAMRAHKQPFWQAEKNDFGNTIETVPLIGELLLEEFTRGSPNLNEINNIFWTFSQMNCLWLCLVQWLDAQQPTIGNLPRQAMARAMKEFEIKLQQQKTEKDNNNKDNNERLQSLSYSILISRRLLRQLADQRIKKEHPYTWLIGFAQRPLPALPMGRKMSLLRADREEIKEENQRLKEVFLCANQQSWATPDAIAHINRCNESCRMDIWLQCWMRQMMNHQRIVTVDEGELASELCLAATMTYPVPCLCEMIKQLVECILFERPTSTSSNNNNNNNITTIASSSSAPNIVSSSNVSNTNSSEEQKNVSSTTKQQQQTNNISQQKHSLSEIDQQQQHLIKQQQTKSSSSHPTLTQLIISRHPVVGQLSTKATVIAKMLVRAMQLLLWAGDRRVIEKKERERRIQQFGLTTQQQPSETTNCRKRKQQEGTTETIEDKEQQMEQQTSTDIETDIKNKKSSNDLTMAPKDSIKAQLTVRNVFERFQRIVKDSTLRPPVTFIIFFIHELAAAPRTEYWQRLVSIMPVNLIFALAYLDPHAIPLELFMQLYDPEDEKNRKHCMRYAFMIRKLGNA